MVHINDFGDEGTLVLIGGGTGPKNAMVTTNDVKTSGVEPRPMDTVNVYDIAKDHWYEQKTFGTAPPGRIQFCSAVVPAQDNSSYSIVIYGGNSVLTGQMFGDTWVLSLPSFQWIKVEDTGEKRFTQTCHIVKKSKLLVIGGRDMVQDEVYTNSSGATDWTCLKDGFLSVLDLNTFKWVNSLVANDENYLVHNEITAVIGGKYVALN